MSASDRSHRPRPSIQPYAIYAPGQPPNFPVRSLYPSLFLSSFTHEVVQGSFSDLSGTYATPVEAAPMQYSCDECHADTIVQYERNKILNRGPDIIPERGSALPRSNGPSAVIFEAKIPGPGGVLVSDILAFRECLMHPGAPVLRHTPGTVSVALSVCSLLSFLELYLNTRRSGRRRTSRKSREIASIASLRASTSPGGSQSFYRTI